MATRVHILSQYLWPDDAPTGIYAEHVADDLTAQGLDVVLIGGVGRYREGSRSAPKTRIERVRHFEGRRGHLLSTALEYEAVRRAFHRYIRGHVAAGDVVVVTSAPPTTISLIAAIRQRGATGVYWLQDYYPQLIRGVVEQPAFVRRRLQVYWNRRLAAWHHVVKAAGNLGYTGANASVIRNWPTLELGSARPFRPRTALYTGNLGYGHHLGRFVEMCRSLHEQGVEVTVRGDGPGMRALPDWIRREPPCRDPETLIRSYWDAELHLVAGHPDFPDAVFPSKFWNAHATGRPVLASGFAGVMHEELEVAKSIDGRLQRQAWTGFLMTLAGGL